MYECSKSFGTNYEISKKFLVTDLQDYDSYFVEDIVDVSKPFM